MCGPVSYCFATEVGLLKGLLQFVNVYFETTLYEHESNMIMLFTGHGCAYLEMTVCC